MLGFSWIDPENKHSVMVRTYFNFLDKIIGKGLFLIFLSMILIDKQDQGEVIVAIVCIIIGVIDLILGCSEGQKMLPSFPWENNSAQ